MDLEHERRLTEVQYRAEDNTRRIDDLEKRQDNLDELVGTVKVLATREEKMEADVKEIKADVKEIASKPGKRWEAVVEKVLITLAAAIVGFLLAQIGIG